MGNLKKFILMVDYGADGWSLVGQSNDFEEIRRRMVDEFWESWSNGSAIIITGFVQCNLELKHDHPKNSI